MRQLRIQINIGMFKKLVTQFIIQFPISNNYLI